MNAQAGLIKDRLAGWTILIAEDDEDAARVAVRWFKLAGAMVVRAANGQIALALARHALPMLIISDLHMPVMDGWALCSALKRDAATCHIPVVALTADHSSLAIKRASDAGFSGLIRKPLDPHKFIDELIAVIEKSPDLAESLVSYEGELSGV